MGGLHGQEASLFDLSAGEGDVLQYGALLSQQLTEGRSRGDPGYHQLQAPLRHAYSKSVNQTVGQQLGKMTIQRLIVSGGEGTDGTHAVVNTAGPEAALRDLKSAALAQQDVAGGHTHVL